MDERTASVLDDAFPDRDVDGLRPTGPSWNEANRTVGVEFADGRTAYVKMALDGDGSRVGRERAVIDYVDANCDVPVPAVLATETDGPVPYLATAPLPSRPLIELWGDADPEDRVALARQVGRALAGVHARRFEDHGHVAGGGAGGLELETAPWTDVLADTIEDLRERSPSDRFEHHFDEVLAAVEANRELLDGAPAALVHGDPAQPNCVHDSGGMGFVDWELAHVGDPARDVYRARDQQFEPLRGDAPDQIVTAFRDGYRERAGGLPNGLDERRPVYAAVRLLGASGFFERTAEFVGVPAEELADWLGGEMDRRIAAL